jgi:hypothetical protein
MQTSNFRGIDLSGEVAIMGTILQFRPSNRQDAPRADIGEHCEIVIFPGVRIERHDDSVDLAARLSGPKGSFNGFGGRRPRKTS